MNEPDGSDQSRALTIARSIRQRIVSGQFPPGSQLPTWGALEQEFGVTRTTLNRVFHRLKSDGFVYSPSTRGTFVVERPPHLSRYGLAFEIQPGEVGWNRWFSTLANESLVLQEKDNVKIPCFFSVENHLDNESHNRLLGDVVSDRLAGLICVGHPEMVARSIWDRADLPKVGVWNKGVGLPWPSVYIDRQSFIEKSTRYLAARGCKKLAVITTTGERLHEYAEVAASHGLMHPDHWRLACAANASDCVRPIIQLLMSLPKQERPDALIIADDNLVEDSIAALMSVGVRVPGDLQIVVHCNWPQPVNSILPVRRLGFDGRRTLETAMSLIDRQRQGEPFPEHESIPTVFEDEI